MGLPGDERQPSALTCFIIGPIGNRLATVGSPERNIYEDALQVLEEVIVPACEHHDLAAVRADNLARAGEITDQIFRRLRDDDIVIADLTGANANVMYELGLRHTRDKLTIQIGEVGRLPFDVSAIRTIQFSRTAFGLVEARKQLIAILEAGLRGEFDRVTATRLWNGPQEQGGLPDEVDPADIAESSEALDERGFVDILADAEEQQEHLAPAIEAVTACMQRLGELAENAAEQTRTSDAANRGMRGRKQIVLRFASDLAPVADELEAAVERYAGILLAVSAGNFVLIQAMEDDADAREGGRSYGMLLRQTAAVSRSNLGSLASMVESMKANAKLSVALREPTRRIVSAFDRFARDTSITDEWDRRLQAMGIPLPPEGWEPDLGADGAGEP